MSYANHRSRSNPHAFPYRQLTILAICRLSEPIAFMSIFPYVYYMIKSFHITDNEERIALYMGMTISAFAFAEAISSSIWGRISDKFGRKSILLCGLAGTGISMLLFGFATNIYVALLARALGGLLNGNIGVLQTTISEVVKNEAHKGIGFALMPAIWCVGAAIGSALGGSLADPVRSYPDIFPPGGLLDQYPYLLPNLVCCFVVVIAITVGVLFLEETHEDLQDHRDVGLRTGAWIEAKLSPKRLFGRKQDYSMETLALLHEDEPPPDYRSAAPSPGLEATAAGLPPPYQSLDPSSVQTDVDILANSATDVEDIEAASPTQSAVKSCSGIWSALSTQLLLNIVGLGLLAYHTISAEQLLPVLFSMPESDEQARLPFWFTGGFGLSTKSIGGILSLQGIIQMVATMVVFPYVELRLGTLRTYRMVVLTYPLLYILVPYLTLVPVGYRMPAVYAILVWKVTAQAFAFPSNNMMLANSIPKRQRGTFNGVAQSSASLARAIGPTVSGLLEAAGLSKGMLGLPWWINAFVAILGALLSLCMVEQTRRSVTTEKTTEEDEDPDESILPAISPDVDAALVAARSSNPPADNMDARPSSPLLTRLSLDIRRSMQINRKS